MRTAELPKSLRELAEIIGEENALKLAEAFAGQRITIPKVPTLYHPLSETLGPEHAYLLSWHCGGLQIEIPLCRALQISARNQAIRAARRQGATIADLVTEYQLCRRSIFLALQDEPRRV